MELVSTTTNAALWLTRSFGSGPGRPDPIAVIRIVPIRRTPTTGRRRHSIIGGFSGSGRCRHCSIGGFSVRTRRMTVVPSGCIVGRFSIRTGRMIRCIIIHRRMFIIMDWHTVRGSIIATHHWIAVSIIFRVRRPLIFGGGIHSFDGFPIILETGLHAVGRLDLVGVFLFAWFVVTVRRGDFVGIFLLAGFEAIFGVAVFFLFGIVVVAAAAGCITVGSIRKTGMHFFVAVVVGCIVIGSVRLLRLLLWRRFLFLLIDILVARLSGPIVGTTTIFGRDRLLWALSLSLLFCGCLGLRLIFGLFGRLWMWLSRLGCAWRWRRCLTFPCGLGRRFRSSERWWRLLLSRRRCGFRPFRWWRWLWLISRCGCCGCGGCGCGWCVTTTVSFFQFVLIR